VGKDETGMINNETTGRKGASVLEKRKEDGSID